MTEKHDEEGAGKAKGATPRRSALAELAVAHPRPPGVLSFEQETRLVMAGDMEARARLHARCETAEREAARASLLAVLDVALAASRSLDKCGREGLGARQSPSTLLLRSVLAITKQNAAPTTLAQDRATRPLLLAARRFLAELNTSPLDEARRAVERMADAPDERAKLAELATQVRAAFPMFSGLPLFDEAKALEAMLEARGGAKRMTPSTHRAVIEAAYQAAGMLTTDLQTALASWRDAGNRDVRAAKEGREVTRRVRGRTRKPRT